MSSESARCRGSHRSCVLCDRSSDGATRSKHVCESYRWSRRVGMSALYRSGARHATARQRGRECPASRLNSVRVTAYNRATGADFRTIRSRRTLDSNDGGVEELC